MKGGKWLTDAAPHDPGLYKDTQGAAAAIHLGKGKGNSIPPSSSLQENTTIIPPVYTSPTRLQRQAQTYPSLHHFPPSLPSPYLRPHPRGNPQERTPVLSSQTTVEEDRMLR
ncbi:hypothetical protein Pcinc_011398 [Petrolisthes cinctipes]|uniref:Uncharacterized protein n=1 Tax=Petrolisthes cinctipes TaxID=88211 RepID=A0AAE1KUG5_PETCI|nr:hypothetical protein Pcinc_011398 [Petrolisthes cinctipes]